MTAFTGIIGAALLAVAPPAAASEQAPASGNAEVKAMFDADQAARQDISKINPEQLFKADSERRERTRVLIDEGRLASADDFYYAAFIFQHGGEPADYLLAHTLAIAAVAEGRKDAKWIAAATLDRYLQELHQPQIYGTQYLTKMDGITRQEPYDRALVPDALRKVLGVPVLADQEKRRAEMQARRAKANPPVKK
jgi:hypothetical protein